MRVEDDPTKEDLKALSAWLKQSDTHQSVFEELSALWGNLDALKALPDYAESNDTKEALNHSSSFFSNWRKSFFAIAASTLICVGLASYLFLFQHQEVNASYVTKTGKQRDIDLPDGSVITLNSGTAIDVNFEQDVRNIYLKKGEAFFQVAPDKSRPFSVQTKNGVVTAVGTAFTVRVQDENMDVLVTEGKIALTATDDFLQTPKKNSADNKLTNLHASTLVELTAGQNVVFNQQVEEIKTMRPDEAEKKLDWRDGVLVFKGESLEQVIADVSRYTEMHIEIAGDDLKTQPIAGYFKVGETEALFDALHMMSDIEVERVSPNRVRLYKR